MLKIRPELLQIFIKEVEGYLDDIDRLMTSDPANAVLIGGTLSLRDIVHNLKGVASTVGLDPMAAAARRFLGILEQTYLAPNRMKDELAERLRIIRAAIGEMLKAVRDGDPEASERIWEEFKQESDRTEAEHETLQTNLSTELRDIFLSEALDNLVKISQTLTLFFDNAENTVLQKKLFRFLINMKGSAAIVNQREISKVLDIMIGRLEEIEEGRLACDADTKCVFDIGLETIGEMLKSFEKGRDDQAERFHSFHRRMEQLLPDELLDETRATADEPDDFPHQDYVFDEEQFRRELRSAFRTEGAEHLDALAQMIVEAETKGWGRDTVNRFFRVVHTLKGAAATVGFEAIAGSAHQLEDLLERWRDSGVELTESAVNLLFKGEETFRRMLDALDSGEEALGRIGADLDEAVQRFLDGQGTSEAAEVALEGNQGTAPEASPARPGFARVPADPAQQAETAADHPVGTRYVRVSMNRLDQLMNLISELHTYRSRLDEFGGAFLGLSKKLKWERKNLNKAVGQFLRRHQWSERALGLGVEGVSDFSGLEFDSYSDLAVFSSNLEELDFKISSIVKKIERMLVRFNEEGLAFSDLVNTIREEMIQVRMVPIETLFRVVDYQTRNLARTLEKKVRVELSGGATEIDKGIVDNLGDSLMHMIRNCLDHGIEAPQDRLRVGKPETGTIRLEAMPEEQRVVITVEDDGAGVNVERISEVALELGILSEDELDRRSRDELLDLVFYPQISTQRKADGVSGRGVGMDAVRQGIAELYGSIQIESEPNRGTRFTIKLPLTLALQPIITVRCDTHHFNIPMHYVERIYESLPEGAAETDGELIRHRDESFMLRWLAGFFRIEHSDIREEHPIVILRSGDRRLGLLVDAVTERDEVIVRPLPPLLETCVQFLGSSITPQGDVRLVLNIPYLFERDDKLPPLSQTAPETTDRVKILIADDSLSVRQTIKFMLKKHGLKANTAIDGLIAWQKLHGIRPHLVIVDLEMPNMNGYELIERIRASPSFTHLPLLVLTSRGGEKHHQKAMAAGADNFLSKPVLERDLVQAIRALLPPDMRKLMDERDPQMH